MPVKVFCIKRMQIFKGGTQTNNFGNRRCTGFKFMGNVIERGAFETDAFNHFSAPCQGGMASSIARRPYSAPMPVGP